MKLSVKTLKILNNFAKIKNSILIVPGNVLRTKNDFVFAAAQVEEHFEHRIPIYDLTRFLGILTSFDKPEIDVEKDHMVIRSGNSSFKYLFSPERLINGVEKNIVFPEDNVKVEFELKQGDLKRIEAIMRIASLPHIVLRGQNGKAFLEVTDVKIKSVSSLKMEIGEVNKDFSVCLSAEKLYMLPGDYHVRVGSNSTGDKFLVEFAGDNVVYYYNGMKVKTYE